MQLDNLQQENMQDAIVFENVTFSYLDESTPAVKDVSFSVKKGEFLAIIGHNGSGKSTIARLTNGLLSADLGKVKVFGLDTSEPQDIIDIRKRVGIVFQNPDNQTVASIIEDDVAFGPENIGVEREEIGKRITWALETVKMQKYRYGTTSRLSGGQKQRIAIAGVLALKPDVIILDESTAMLDPMGRREVMETVTRLNKEEGMTVIIITHFMEEALLCDRAIVLNRGEIVMQGTPSYIFTHSDILDTYNLALPRISVICKCLNDGGMSIGNHLYESELAKDIASNFDNKGVVNRVYIGGNRQRELNYNEWNIDVKHLNYTYSASTPFAKKALNDVNLFIQEGEFFGIIGHTGSGKSTLIQHFNALIKLPTAEKKYKEKKKKKDAQDVIKSTITIGNYDLSNKNCPFNELRQNVGMVFQYPEYQLFAETVFDDVAFSIRNYNKNIEKSVLENMVRESLEMVGLDYDEVKDKSPFDLSGGQKRRVAIAGVIVSKPKILILDEPAAGLDPLGKVEIMELLHKIHNEWCHTVIVVSHDMDEIADNCTRAAVISNGEIVAIDAPHELFKKGDYLRSLGLDVPIVSKICENLKNYGFEIDTDFTCLDFANDVLSLYNGGNCDVK